MMKKSIFLGLILAVVAAISAHGQYQNPVTALNYDLGVNSKQQLKTGVQGSYPQHIIESTWKNQWMPYATEDIQYRVDGMPLVIERAESSGKTRELYSYDDRDWAFETVFQEWVNNEWVNTERATGMMSDDGDYLGYTIENWESGLWVLDQGMQYEYQKTGSRIDVMITQIKRPDQPWTNMQRYTYAFGLESEQPAETLMEIWEENAWHPSFKMQYTYNGDVTEELQSSYVDGTWVLVSKMITEMGENDSFTMTNYSPAGSEWMPSSRTTYEYDVIGNSTLFLVEFFNEGWVPVMGTKYILTYAGSNLVERITQTFSPTEPGMLKASTSGTWVNSLLQQYSDFHTAGINPVLLDEVVFQVYPNPAKEYLYIKAINPGAEEKVLIRMVDLAGKEVLRETRVIASHAQFINLPIRNLKMGNYIIQIRAENGKNLINKQIQIQ